MLGLPEKVSVTIPNQSSPRPRTEKRKSHFGEFWSLIESVVDGFYRILISYSERDHKTVSKAAFSFQGPIK